MYVVFEAGVRRVSFVDLRRLGPILRRVAGDHDEIHYTVPSPRYSYPCVPDCLLWVEIIWLCCTRQKGVMKPLPAGSRMSGLH